MASHVVSVVMGGLFHAAILFLVAAGLQVVFGVQRIFNLACGSFYALGAYVGVAAVQAFIRAGGPPELFILPLAVAGLLAGLVGIAGGARPPPLRLRPRRDVPAPPHVRRSSSCSRT